MSCIPRFIDVLLRISRQPSVEKAALAQQEDMVLFNLVPEKSLTALSGAMRLVALPFVCVFSVDHTTGSVRQIHTTYYKRRVVSRNLVDRYSESRVN
jgi:hypothetical protein